MFKILKKLFKVYDMKDIHLITDLKIKDIHLITDLKIKEAKDEINSKMDETIENMTKHKLNEFYYEIDDMVKSKFEEVGKAYDNLILNEANQLKKYVDKTKKEFNTYKKKGGKK